MKDPRHILSSEQPTPDVAPIHRLPNELLSKIFLLRRELSGFDREVDAKDPLWISLTQVCRRWRAVAITYPFLWCQIPIDIPSPWFELYLERSQPRPLDVRLDLSKRTDPELDALLLHISRVQRLYLIGAAYTLRAFFDKLTMPAPLLEVFECDKHPAQIPDPPFWLPRTLFAGAHPRMHTLDLGTNVRVPVPSLLAAREQIISFVSRGGPSIRNLRLLMRHCRCLESFRFSDGGKIVYMRSLNDTLPDGDSSPIALPKLHTFEVIEMDLTSVVRLFDKLALPSLQMLTLGTRVDKEEWRADLRSLLVSVTSHIPYIEENIRKNPDANGLQHTRLHLSTDRLTISFFPSLDFSPPSPLTLTFSSHNPRTSDTVDIASALYTDLPPTLSLPLQTLTLSHSPTGTSPHLSAPEWHAALSPLTTVEEIRTPLNDLPSAFVAALFPTFYPSFYDLFGPAPATGVLLQLKRVVLLPPTGDGWMTNKGYAALLGMLSRLCLTPFPDGRGQVAQTRTLEVVIMGCTAEMYSKLVGWAWLNDVDRFVRDGATVLRKSLSPSNWSLRSTK